MANADGTNAVQVTRNAVQETSAAISPDNAACCSSLDRTRRFETYYNGRLFVAPAGGGAARVVVGENEPIDVDRAIWSKDGKSIYFLANLGVHEELFVVPAAGGKPRQLTDGKHSLGGSASLAGDRVRVHRQRLAQRRRRSGRWRRATRRRSRSRTCSTTSRRDFKLGRQEAIHVEGRRRRRPSRASSPIRWTIRPAGNIRSR